MVKHGLRGNTNNIEMYPRGLDPESGPLFLASAEVNAESTEVQPGVQPGSAVQLC
jgi:hypothetical protein